MHRSFVICALALGSALLALACQENPPPGKLYPPDSNASIVSQPISRACDCVNAPDECGDCMPSRCGNCKIQAPDVTCAGWCVEANWDKSRPEPTKAQCDKLRNEEVTISNAQDKQSCWKRFGGPAPFPS